MSLQVIMTDYTVDAVQKIGKAAAICYDADTSEGACIRRATHCKASGHLSTLRFAYATMSISGISRVCSHQLVRIAHAGILQESQRYVKKSVVEHVTPPALGSCPEEYQKRWHEATRLADELYYEAVDKKYLKKEDARYILQSSCVTKVNLCLNFQGWRDFLANRTDKASQWEIREVAVQIQSLLQGIAPEIFN